MKSTNPNSKSAKILVIEDDDDLWGIMQVAIYQCISEITVQRVASVEETMILLKEWDWQDWELPKLILLDLYLPLKTDGLQLLKNIKAMPNRYNRIPVVMLTGSEAPVDIKEAYQLGISAYTIKPIEFADWLIFFQQLRTYWWETVTLPPIQY